MFFNPELTSDIVFFIFILCVHFGIVQTIKNFTKIELKINSTILFFLQVLFFVLVYVGGFETTLLFHEPRKGDIGWGIAVYIFVWIYIFSSFVCSLIVGLFSKAKEVLFLALIFTVFACLPISVFFDRPLRVSLILVSGFVGITFPYFIQKKIINVKKCEEFD
jgi:hypothetical protein